MTVGAWGGPAAPSARVGAGRAGGSESGPYDLVIS